MKDFIMLIIFFLKFYEIKGCRGYKNYYDKKDKSFTDVMSEVILNAKSAEKEVKEPLLKNELIVHSDFGEKRRKLSKNRKFGLSRSLFRTYFKIKSFFTIQDWWEGWRIKPGKQSYKSFYLFEPTYYTHLRRKNSFRNFESELFNFDDSSSKNIKFFFFLKTAC